MYRCGDCIWFAPKTRHGFNGKCVTNDKDCDRLTKRCNDNFEKKEL